MRIDVFGDTLCASVTAAALAQSGHEVCWFIPEGRVLDAVNEDRVPYREPGLGELLGEQRAAGRLRCEPMTLNGAPAAPAVFLALQPGAQALAGEIADWLAGSGACGLLVNQSVFPVGTSEALQRRLAEARSPARVVALPETLQEGVAIDSFLRPHHILLGCDDPQAETLMREILRPFNRRRDVIRVMGLREAEFTKLAISGMLATRLSYMNDMALLAEQLDVDIDTVRQGVGSDPRIGEAYLYAGCGFGGSGFSRDVMSLTDTLRSKEVSAKLLEQVMEINERQKEVLFRRFWRHFEGEVAGRRVAIWGAAFKPGSDRVDNGPALKLIEALWAQDVQVHVHDPLALPELGVWADGHPDLILHDDPYQAVAEADALMLVTEWKQYWSPDWSRLRDTMGTPLILDGRNIYDPEYVRGQGLLYHGIGRG